MVKYKNMLFYLFLILLVIFEGCVTPPKANTDSQLTIKTTLPSAIKPTTTTMTTTSNNSLMKTPMFSIGQVALQSQTGSSGLAIVNVFPEIGLYGTLDVKRISGKGSNYGWYLGEEQIILYKNFSEVDIKYKNFEAGINPTRIPIVNPLSEKNVIPKSSPCNVLGDWKIANSNTIYKLRNDGTIINQTFDRILIGSWDIMQTNDAMSYIIYWNYGPEPNYPNYQEKITVSKDLTKIDVLNNYGKKYAGTWMYAQGPIGTEKRCSDWPGSNN